jgi:plasmid stabilization system protein ParE
VRRKSYVLTARAAADLIEARAWSRARWGKELTNRYFEDLHEGAQYIAENHASIRDARNSPEAVHCCCIRFVSTTSCTNPLGLDSLP